MRGTTVAGPSDQWVGWGFQILPFLEETAIYNIRQGVINGRIPYDEVKRNISSNSVKHYFCPSRRGSDNVAADHYPIDYACAVPTNGNLDQPSFDWGEFYCGAGSASERNKRGRYACTAFGIIVRSATWGKAARVAQVTDGLSHTMMYGEKWIQVSTYETGSTMDDDGWTDGYEADIVRSTALQPRADSLDLDYYAGDTFAMGSAHPSGINACFGDNSVHFIGFDVDPMIFNLWGNREDGRVIESPEL